MKNLLVWIACPLAVPLAILGLSTAIICYQRHLAKNVADKNGGYAWHFIVYLFDFICGAFFLVSYTMKVSPHPQGGITSFVICVFTLTAFLVFMADKKKKTVFDSPAAVGVMGILALYVLTAAFLI